MVHPAHALGTLEVSLMSVSNGGHFTPEVKEFFVHISHRIAVGSLSNIIWYSLRMRHKQ
jgi:hypothetical protein